MMPSFSSSEPSAMKCAPIVEVRTQECLEELRDLPLGELANIIILIGKTGVGKSTLLEYLTNALGHSKESPNPVTLSFQLEHIKLSGKRYYIMDTPGFDTDKEQDVFRKIIEGIEAVRPYTKIVGVMLVTKISDTRVEAIDNKIIAFVDKLCGLEYASQVTVVTTFWSLPEPEDKEVFEERLEERLQRWRVVLGQNLKQYQHGRRYDSSGKDVGECLKWRRDPDEFKKYAKEMVVRHYGTIIPRDPVIIQELSAKRPLGKTAAGKFLGIVPAPQPHPSSTSGPTPEATTPPSDTSEPEEETSKPSSPPHGANPYQSQPQKPPEQPSSNVLLDGLKWVVGNVIVPILKSTTINVTTGGSGGMTVGGVGGRTGRGARGRFPSHLDPKSSEDNFKARGLRSDLPYRTQWAQARGITLEPGSHAFGDAVLNRIKRDMPLD